MNRRTASLTTRLALLFGVIAALTFALAGTYLYRTLADQLERRDDAELLGKVELVRHLLREVKSTEFMRQDPHLFQDAIVGHAGLLVDIRSIADELLVTNIEAGTVVPQPSPVEADRTPDHADIVSWTTPQGIPGRAVAAFGRTGGAGPEVVRIFVARQASERAALLAAYKRNVLAAAFGGTLITALLGHAVVGRGLKPVQEIAAKARQISTNRLDARPTLENAPAELQELVVAFNQMLDRVKDGVDRLSRFSSDLAHDLRTPITNLLGETQVVLARPRSSAQYQALLESNVEELERLSRMIENMLFLARADDAQLALHVERLDAAAELGTIAEYFAGIAADANVAICIRGRAIVTADQILFQRAVSNLVANAIHHSPAGAEIDMVVAQCSKWIVITVANRGPLIPADIQPLLFDRFYRTDSARTSSASSSGLGLAIVHSIMELHGGTVSVRSNENEGTIFELDFPRGPQDDVLDLATYARTKADDSAHASSSSITRGA